ncbi:MAG: ABC transporter permease, partial [Proteobacteria bacterium]|nr:ABC transporter permease [Pseudomonadota bacterium]
MPADTLKKPGRLRRFLDSDIGWSFCHTPVAWLSALVLALLVLSALFAPLIAP